MIVAPASTSIEPSKVGAIAPQPANTPEAISMK
jgi:hypothetical protein